MNQTTSSIDPIRRLYEILSHAYELTSKEMGGVLSSILVASDGLSSNASGDSDENIFLVERDSHYHIWAKVFGIEAHDTAKLIICFGAFLELIQKSKHRIKNFEGVDVQTYLSPFDSIEYISSRFFHSSYTWKELHKVLDRKHFLTTLQFCVDQSRHQEPGYKKINLEKLNSLGEELMSLRNEIINMTLPYDLKKTLLNSLRKMDEAIIMFKLRGVDGINEALNESIGGILRLWKKYPHHFSKNKVFTSVLNKLGNVEMLLSLNDQLQLSQTVSRLLR